MMDGRKYRMKDFSVLPDVENMKKLKMFL